MAGYFLAPGVGLEPTTNRLTVDRSTTELPRNVVFTNELYTHKKGRARFSILPNLAPYPRSLADWIFSILFRPTPITLGYHPSIRIPGWTTSVIPTQSSL
jgi:hypothetical protein